MEASEIKQSLIIPNKTELDEVFKKMYSNPVYRYIGRRIWRPILEKPYLSSENFPWISPYVKEIQKAVSERLNILGLEPDLSQDIKVRIIEEEKHTDKQTSAADELLGGRIDAVSIPEKDLVIVRSNPDKLDEVNHRLLFLSRLTHEIIHLNCSNKGLSRFSKLIDEGLTEILTLEIMRERIIPLLAIESSRNQNLLKQILSLAQINVYENEISVVEKIHQDSGDELFNSLLKAYHSGMSIPQSE